MTKFHNVKTSVGTETFDSKAEADDWVTLCLRQKNGDIRGLERQVPFELQPRWKDLETGRWHRAITYVADFVYDDNGVPTILETKGVRTAVYALKEKMLRFRFPHYRLIVHQVESNRRRR